MMYRVYAYSPLGWNALVGQSHPLSMGPAREPKAWVRNSVEFGTLG